MRALAHVRHNLIAYLALFIALGGTSYAAISIPRNSVGAAQLKNHSITPAKLSPSAIGGYVRAWAIVNANGTIVRSSEKATSSVQNGDPGGYSIYWSSRFPADCPTVASVNNLNEGTGYATRVVTGANPREPSYTGVSTFNMAGEPTPLAFNVVVVC
jgi:hypothetical protein